MKPVCVKCHLEMKIKKTGARVEQMMNMNAPYRLWSVDTFACPLCENEVAVNFAKEPISEHYKPDYAKQAATAQLQYWPTIHEIPNRVMDAV